MQSPTAGALQAELHGSSGAKKAARPQDDKEEWHTAIPKSR